MSNIRKFFFRRCLIRNGNFNRGIGLRLHLVLRIVRIYKFDIKDSYIRHVSDFTDSIRKVFAQFIFKSCDMIFCRLNLLYRKFNVFNF